MLGEQHEKWLELVIGMAERNASIGEDPFAAIVVHEGEIAGIGVNRTIAEKDPCSHAELTAVREACKRLNRGDLSDCVLYASGEPCPMCMGAIYWAKLKAVYFACGKDEAARVTGFGDPLGHFASDLSGRPENRAIPFYQVPSPARLDPFREWQRRITKTNAKNNNE